MAERKFEVILRFASRVPSMATCKNCHYKFLTSSNLRKDAEGAETYLREKFNQHECKGERAPIRDTRPWSNR
jgi:hypothetical protein